MLRTDQFLLKERNHSFPKESDYRQSLQGINKNRQKPKGMEEISEK